jgi:hypothetical protein
MAGWHGEITRETPVKIHDPSDEFGTMEALFEGNLGDVRGLSDGEYPASLEADPSKEFMVKIVGGTAYVI